MPDGRRALRITTNFMQVIMSCQNPRGVAESSGHAPLSHHCYQLIQYALRITYISSMKNWQNILTLGALSTPIVHG